MEHSEPGGAPNPLRFEKLGGPPWGWEFVDPDAEYLLLSIDVNGVKVRFATKNEDKHQMKSRA